MRPIVYLLLVVIASRSSAQTIIRGPYLNLATRTSIIIRWKTDVATNSKVSFGTTKENLNKSVVVDTVTNEHIVQLTGLAVNTKYFYSVGSVSQVLQGDSYNYFKTAPTAGSTQKVRILAMGDMGLNSPSQKSVRDAYLNYNGTNYTDIWMLLGDNAYDQGTESNYNNNFFRVYQQNLSKNHVLWPSPGNHEYANNAARQADHNIAYYRIFSLPAHAEAGGIASNTKAYYSYNYGNIHFVSLDSYGWEKGNTRLYDTLGPQMTWLKRDLAANTQQWTVVYFHHPPYSKGRHDSDADQELIKIRQNLVRILERYKVDLVLNGHSHDYERSYLINGHYGFANTFDPATHAVSNSSGKYDGSTNSCPYIKNSSDVRNGVVYAVVGSAGSVIPPSATYPHDAMSYSNVTDCGAMVIEIENNRLDAKWICSDGVIRDKFTIFKQVNKKTDITVAPSSNISLSASWPGNYTWSTGETARTINIAPSTNTTYIVGDNLNCLADTFNVIVSNTIDKVKLSPAADAFVRNGSYAAINYGTDTSLIVKSSTSSGYSRATYLKFSLDSISKVKDAVLRVYGKNKDGSSVINICAFAVTNDWWTEKGITWNNAPAPSSPSLSRAGISDQLKYYEFNVTDFVKTQNMSDKTVTFLIKDTAYQNKNLVFNSRENNIFRPELLITIDTVSQPSSPSPDTIAPVADAFVRDGSYAAKNYGSDTLLVVKRSTSGGFTRSSYLKFSLNPVSNVGSAKLRIYGRNTESTANINTSFFGLDTDTWTEGGITFSNAPAASSAALGVVAINNIAKYYEVDVTNFMKAQYAGDKTASLLIKDEATQNKNLNFNSRENANYRPQLIIYPNAARTSGSNNQSSIAAKFLTDQNIEKPKVYPNPLNNSFTIQLPAQYTGAFALHIADPSGETFEIGKYQLKPGERSLNIDISHLSLRPGVYFLKINSTLKNEFIKLIIN
jgi:hypothetical protein